MPSVHPDYDAADLAHSIDVYSKFPETVKLDANGDPIKDTMLDDLIKKAIDTIDQIKPDTKTTIDQGDLIGTSEIDDGGFIGSLLKLYKVHIEDMQNAGQIDNKVASEIYGRMLEVATSAAIQVATANIELSDKSLGEKLKAITAAINAKKAALDTNKSKFEASLAQYKLEVTNPIMSNIALEDRLIKHAQHEAEEAKTFNERVMAGWNETTKKFEANKSAGSEQLEALKQNTLIAHAKRYQEQVNAGRDSDDTASGFKRGANLSKLKNDQIEIQTKLYEQQIDSYNDVRYQKLLDTIVNYNAMIFPDLDATSQTGNMLNWAIGNNAGRELYNALNPPTLQALDGNPNTKSAIDWEKTEVSGVDVITDTKPK